MERPARRRRRYMAYDGRADRFSRGAGPARHPRVARHASPAGSRRAARLAEIWLVEYSAQRELAAVVSSDYLGELNVRFTRLLTFSEQAALRSSYETEINGILKRSWFGKIY